MPESDLEKKPQRRFFRLGRRAKRKRLRYITVLPSLITLLNGVCGFAAIYFASKIAGSDLFFHRLEMSNFAVAAYMIFFAMVFDMLDGRLARLSHTTSSFGGQLDSLCDAISFGVAPAFLMLRLLDYYAGKTFGSWPFLFTGFVERFVWLAAITYMCCAVVRLARFNVENEEDEAAHMSFIGLPSPAAAGVIAGLVVFYDDMTRTMGVESAATKITENAVVCSLPLISIAAGLLMTSRIRYPHFVNQYLRGKKPVTHFFWSAAVIGFIYLAGLQSALAIVFCGFAGTGFVKWFYYHVVAVKMPKRPVPAQFVQSPGQAAEPHRPQV